MRAFISTSRGVLFLSGALALLVCGTTLRPSWGADAGGAKGGSEKNDKSDKTIQPEDDDFSPTPFTEYGEFNEESEEINDMKFFQHGRFFGVSLGSGFEGVTGNRGLLWQGGFPMIDVKVHYWFDFNLAIDLQLMTGSHFFDGGASVGHVDVNMTRLALDVKYYFETKNLSGAVTFANPYVLLGAGVFTKTQTFQKDGSVDPDTAAGLSAGAGLEFAISPGKIYFTIENKWSFVTFKDSYTKVYSQVPDLTGLFFTIAGGVLFTW